MNTPNTSGYGKLATIPPEIRKWNWGAFWLGAIWGLCNNVWISLLLLIPTINVVMWFILGAKGNEWAWQSKKWDSIEHFERTQKAWARWGLVLFIIFIIIVAVIVVLNGINSNYLTQ